MIPAFGRWVWDIYDNLILAAGQYLQTNTIKGTDGTTAIAIADSGVLTLTQFSAWTAVDGGVGFGTGWSDYGGEFTPVAYRKIGDTVEIRGMIKFTTGSAITIFTLPAGSRPATNRRHLFSAPGFDGNTPGFTLSNIEIHPSGIVELNLGPASHANTFVSLSGIQFSTL